MDSVKLHALAPTNNPLDVLARGRDGATPLPVAVRPIPASGSITPDCHATPRIFVAHAGLGNRHYRYGLRTLDLRTAPRMIEVYEGGLVFDSASWSGQAGRCVEIQFRDTDVQALTRGELQALPLKTRHELFDERVSSLALQLAVEALADGPREPLYAQGLCLALLGVLLAEHCRGSRGTSPAGDLGGLSPEQQRRVADLVAAEFGSKLTLDRMAAETGLSPHHFARLFKRSFDATPHEYVQGVRLDAAMRALLAGGERPIAEIAQACGFASQSHMTESMRRSCGVTPGHLQRGIVKDRCGRVPYRALPAPTSANEAPVTGLFSTCRR